MVNKKRNVGLDLVKGICILLVVLSHAMQFEDLPVPFGEIFSNIFLTSFFCVTGYLSYEKAGCETHLRIKKKFLYLIKPYVLYSFITIIWHAVTVLGFNCTEVSETFFGTKLLYRDFFCFISGIGIGTLWFLPVLFISFVISEIIICLAKRMQREWQFFFLLAMIAIFLATSEIVSTVTITESGMAFKLFSVYIHTLHRIIYGTAYMLIGGLMFVLLNHCGNRTVTCDLMVAICLLFGVTIMHLIEINVLTQCLQVISFFFICISLLNRIAKKTKIITSFVYCGENSLRIMFYHYNILWPIEKMTMKSVCGGVL